MKIGLLIILILALGVVSLAQEAPETVKPFLAEIAAKARTAEETEKPVITGSDGWLFFAPELRSMSAGQFWGENAAKVCQATKAENADPLPAILDFKAQLDKAGISLLLVPVPAKGTIYPDKLSTLITVEPGKVPPRSDIYVQEFITKLKDEGVSVLDLTPGFLQHRNDPEGTVYCQQDTHWSGRACVLAADMIHQQYRTANWLRDLPVQTYATETRPVTITGDLWIMRGDDKAEKESLPLTFVGVRDGEALTPIVADKSSPILLLGDSHNLVFYGGGDMLAQGAGLADQLALRFGFPLDVVAVRGSGATPARLNLLRRGDNLAGKKLVIWCFTVREFTESVQGWKPITIIRP